MSVRRRAIKARVAKAAKSKADYEKFIRELTEIKEDIERRIAAKKAAQT